jgi:hypothetical protein
MNFASFLNVAVQVMTVLAPRTQTTVDDKILAGLKALSASPELIAWVQSLFSAGGTLPPDGAFSMTEVPAELRPKLELLGGLGDFAKLLPVLLELYRIWKTTQK